jgi:hypothetical protein
MAGALQGPNDTFLLLRVDLDEQIGAGREVPLRLIPRCGKILARQHRTARRDRFPDEHAVAA